jgi:ribose transport system substrate-binding protein
MKRAIFVALAVALVTAGCGGGKESAPAPGGKPAPLRSVKVAFVTNNASDFWKIAKAGTDKAAKELGCEVLFRIPATGTAQEQLRLVEDLITVGVSGIAIR